MSQRVRHDWVTELNWTELNLILVKEEKTNPKVSRRKEVIKIRAGKIK